MNQTISFDGETIPDNELPRPTGWQVLLAPVTITEKSSGGIIIQADTRKAQESVRFISKVLAVGPLAYTGDKFKEHPDQTNIEPWCKVGDVISTGQYAGSQIPCTYNNESFYLRLVADDEIKTVIVNTTILDI